ncbi:MAG: DUF4062 domain-containing protein [Akkermansiaceae bacterium]|nr:DUF4062 domain-containing protein [Akkermansiaceae bacterium]
MSADLSFLGLSFSSFKPRQMKSNRVFISCVSSEFERETGAYPGLRSKLRRYLTKAECEVKVQEEFRQTEVDTLEKLDHYIRTCAAVIHLVGSEFGSVADATAVETYLKSEPKFLDGFPKLKADLGDFSGLSYTQWEAFIALHHGLKPFVYRTAADDVQEFHLERLIEARRHASPFSDAEDLLGQLIGDLRHIIPDLPALPSSQVPRYLPARNPHFRGRESDLKRVGELLAESKTIGITQQVAVFASGGVGKSSLALEFAWESLAADPVEFPGGVFWVDCRDRAGASLCDALSVLAEPLGIPTENGETETLSRAVEQRLAAGPPNLLVLDNVNDEAQWKDPEWAKSVPAGNCHRLITTRAEDLGDHWLKMHRLDVLSGPDARALLRSYRNDVDMGVNGDEIDSIIDWFGGLAIGLTVVGIYMAGHRRLGWAAYWRDLQSRKLVAVRTTEDQAVPVDYSNRADAVIDDLFFSLLETEQRVLFYAATLPGEDVSERWLRNLLDEDVRFRHITGVVPPGYDSVSQASIECLMDRGILRLSISTPLRKTLFLHQVIRERIKEIMSRNQRLKQHISQQIRRHAVRNYHLSRQWTQAILEATDFDAGNLLLEAMAQANFEPDVFSFNTLLSKAADYESASGVIERMTEAGIEPDVVSFNTLLSKAADYESASGVIERMTEAGIEPDVVSFTTLLSKAADYESASGVIERMTEAELSPTLSASTRCSRRRRTTSRRSG